MRSLPSGVVGVAKNFLISASSHSLQQPPSQSTFCTCGFGAIRMVFDRVVLVPPSIFAIRLDACTTRISSTQTFPKYISSRPWKIALIGMIEHFCTKSFVPSLSSLGYIRRGIPLFSSHVDAHFSFWVTVGNTRRIECLLSEMCIISVISLSLMLFWRSNFDFELARSLPSL